MTNTRINISAALQILDDSDVESEQDGLNGFESEDEIDNVEISDHNTDTEGEGEEDPPQHTAAGPSHQGSAAGTLNQDFYNSKNGQWAKVPFPTGRVRLANIITTRPGPLGAARNADTPINCLKLFITDNMLDIITIHTNEKIEEYRQRLVGPKEWFTKDITKEELQAVMGIFIYCGVTGSTKESLSDLWASDGTGRPIFAAAMGYKRAEFIISAMRFDDKTNRQPRAAIDKLAAFREVFDAFNVNCTQYYNPGSCITVDEQLHSFRGRVNFKQYMPKKPARYGIKLFMACDSDTSYMLRAKVYLGKEGDQVQRGLATTVVCELIDALPEQQRRGRNVTTDNFFTSKELADRLKDKRMTLVGTMKQNKREVPTEFKASKKRAIGETIFGFTQEYTLSSYVPKKNKVVLLFSSLHHDDAINIETGKPESIMYYNSTKSGVDTLDQLCANYTVQRGSRRWTMALFYDIINISLINAYIVYNCNQQRLNPNFKCKRKVFLKEVAKQLIAPEARRRFACPQTSRKNKTIIQLCGFVGPDVPGAAAQQVPGAAVPQVPGAAAPGGNKRGRCSMCDRKKDTKTNCVCSKCHAFVCKTHASTTYVCQQCENEKEVLEVD